MKRNLTLAGLFLAGFVLPAVAQTTTTTTTTSYYIVQDATKHCRIVDQKPVAKDMTVVGGDGVIYHTRTEAETALKTTKVCVSD